jgi:hypothetical protein
LDPENHQFLMETSLPTPMTARVELLLYQRVTVICKPSQSNPMNPWKPRKNWESHCQEAFLPATSSYFVRQASGGGPGASRKSERGRAPKRHKNYRNHTLINSFFLIWLGPNWLIHFNESWVRCTCLVWTECTLHFVGYGDIWYSR